jgi:hypothetical protein
MIGDWGRLVARATVAALVATASMGCASTSVTAMTSPEFKGATYSRVVVLANINDLALRKSAEEQFCRELAGRVTAASPSVSLFFPDRTYDQTEVGAIYAREGVEVVLVLEVDDVGTTSQWIPPTYNTTTTTNVSGNAYGTGSAVVTRSGNTAYGSGSWQSQANATAQSNSRTTVSGGQFIEKPWARFSARLWDLRRSGYAWTARASSAGGKWSSHEGLLSHAVGEFADALVESGLLAR